jgi:hypothetical protein
MNVSYGTVAPDHMSVRKVRVTPTLAAKWLERNPNNRPVSMSCVQTYAADMKLGRWKVNGATIVFNKKRELIDGQHRLWALLEADTSIDMLVVEGVDEDAKLTIDGGRTRRPADRLWMFGRVERPRTVAASLVLINRVVSKQSDKASAHALWEQYGTYRASFDWALRSIHASYALLAPVYGALVFAHRALPIYVEAFAQELQSRDDQPKSPAAALLRDYFLHHKVAGTIDERVATFLKTLRCIQAFTRSERLAKLYASYDTVNLFLPDTEEE